MKQSSLNLDLLRRVLGYDPETGVFAWIDPPSKRVAVGEHAGAIGSNGRRYIGVMGEKHSAHRLAWFHHYGVWPTGNVKQKNGDHDDVRIDNLVEETAADTARRGALRTTNTSGLRGVSWSEQKGKWVATITRDYRRVHLGYFDDQQAAAAAYAAAVAEMPADRGAEVPSAEAINLRRQQRTIWQRLVRQHGATLGWSSFNLFVVDVSHVPSLSCDLLPLDPTKPIGPGNYAWRERPVAIKRGVKSAYWRERDMLRKFGLTPADADRMAVEQDNLCAICKRLETETRNGIVKNLSIDHCHATGRVRSLLCTKCNKALGLLSDDPALLRAAAAYLESHATPNVVPLKKEA